MFAIKYLNVLVSGLGVSLMFVPAAVVCSTYFDQYRPLALGIASSGVGFFCLCIPPLLRTLIVHYGWRNGLIFMSALCIQSCLFSFLLFPVEYWEKRKRRKLAKTSTQQPDENKNNNNNNNNSSLVESKTLLQNSDILVTSYQAESRWRKLGKYLSSLFDLELILDLKFVIFFVNNSLWNVSSLIIIVMVTDFAIVSQIDASSAPWLVSAIGLSGIFGRIGSGLVSNLLNIERFWTYNIATAVSGLAIGALPFFLNFKVFVLLCALYGVCFGAQCGILALTITELFGVNKLSMAYGYIMVSHGLGAMCGPPLGGLLFEMTNSYAVVFYFAGAVSLFTALLACIIPCLRMTSSKEEQYTQVIVVTQ